MPILNRDFYPTPPPLVRKLIECVGYPDTERRQPYVLDPAAGSGVILDAIQARFEDRYHPPHLYACEIEPELATLLEGKGYPVLASDFLQYQPVIRFDFILMNPPFSQAAKFIIHAFEILPEGGTLVSVLPKSIEKQTNAFEFQAMRLIADHGQVEDVGKPFAQGAERRTAEPCILVTLKKETEGSDGVHPPKLEFDVENDYPDQQYHASFETPEMGMMPNGFLARKFACYQALLQEFANYRQSHRKMVSLLGEFEGHFHKRDADGHRQSAYDTILESAQHAGDDRDAFNGFYSLLTESAWNGILEHPDFQHAMTSRAKKMVDNFRKTRNRVDFNEANIHAMFMALVARGPELLNQCIFDAFDNLTQFHWGNRCHVEGWKHNSQWMVSPHCIVPYGMDVRWGGAPQLSYSHQDTLNDIDKGLCTLMGLPVSALNVYKCPHCGAEDLVVFEQSAILDTMELDRAVCNKCKGEFPYIASIDSSIRRAAERSSWGRLFTSHFFEIRFYKKGTIHLRFRDPAVWQKLNYTAAKLRGWLPDGTQPWHVVWKAKPKDAPRAAPDRYKGYQPYYSGDEDERASDEFTIQIDLKLPAPSDARPRQTATPAPNGAVRGERPAGKVPSADVALPLFANEAE